MSETNPPPLGAKQAMAAMYGKQDADPSLRPYRYRAQTTDSRTLDGTIDAVDPADARHRLSEMGLIVTSIEGESKPRPKTLKGEDFAAFNEQLANLTAAGMPIERGLRLIATDMKSGRLAASVRRVADDLERGRPLHEAFEANRAGFPPIYAQLMQAGVRTGNLPGMLMNIGRHLDLIARLRRSIWRAAAYPLIVLVAMVAVVLFLSINVLPAYLDLFREFDTELPTITKWLLTTPDWLPMTLVICLAAVFAFPFLLRLMSAAGGDQGPIDSVLLRLPLLGPVLKANLLARWLDVLHISLAAGIDLPRSIELAGDAVNSKPLIRDGRKLIESLSAGRSLSLDGREMLPATVLTAIELAPQHGDLPGVIANMSELHQHQAELRAGLFDVLLAPIMLILVTGVLGFVVAALFLPLVTLVQSITA